MAGIASPAFNEIERRISSNSLRLSVDLSLEVFKFAYFLFVVSSKQNDTDMSEEKKYYRDNHYLEAGENLSKSSRINESWFSRNQGLGKYVGILILHILVLIYFIFASLYWSKHNNNCVFEWCDGYGMLLLLVGLTYLGLCYYYIVKRYFFSSIIRFTRPISLSLDLIREKRYVCLAFKTIFYAAIVIGFVIFLIFDTAESRERLISGIGVVVLMVFGFVFSKYPRQVNWRPVIWGLILQFSFGLITIRWPVGRAIFQCIADKVATFLVFAEDGSSFVFSKQLSGIFAFSVLPVIFFFSFMIQILYYLGVMQWIILKLGWVLHIVMGTTVCESLNSAANTFLGMTESPLLIRPYISKLTASEIHSVMCSGFATVSGTVLAAYISFGADPAHLLTASVMSAPAALCYSKLFYPETEKSHTTFKNIPLQKSDDTSVMDAATKGALAGIPLVLGIVANIVAFVSCVSFLNAILSWLGGLVGFPELTFEYILSKAFMPLSWIIGIPWDQCEDVGTLIGLKTVVNEFVAYQKLGEFKRAGRLTARVEGIATYAICGFSNPGSIGIMMGGLGSMAPDKREQIAQVTLRAFIAGSAVCFLTAAIAGILMTDDTYTSVTHNSTTI